MRILLDLQGAQTSSRARGIGRYSTSFAAAVAKNRGQHEVFIALNAALAASIDAIREVFRGILPPENIKIWSCPDAALVDGRADPKTAQENQIIREAFFLGLQPDIIHVCSLFEGFGEPALTGINASSPRPPTTVTLYDLIPLSNENAYLPPGAAYTAFYHEKLDHLRNAALCLTISEATSTEAARHLGLQPHQTLNVSAGADPVFYPRQIPPQEAATLLETLHISRRFVLYSGGGDRRKNLPRLIQAWALLPEHVRSAHQLVFVGSIPKPIVDDLRLTAKAEGCREDDLIFTGHVSEQELVGLYNLSELYVLPSWQEGFGLPILEAMACGTPVICANRGGSAEILQLPEATFDPFSVEDISDSLWRSLSDEALRERMRSHGLVRSTHFTWEKTARLAIGAWERLQSRPQFAQGFGTSGDLPGVIKQLAENVSSSDERHLQQLVEHMARNSLSSHRRQIFIDISELVQHDAATGVQRVVRSYLQLFLTSPPKGYDIKPVYATPATEYLYANHFVEQFLGKPTAAAIDDPIVWTRGDIFFCLDLQHHVHLTKRDFFLNLKKDGVTVKFLLYDLLPVQLPHYFPNEEISRLHQELLDLIALSDGVVCISRATSIAFDQWCARRQLRQAPHFQNSWIHIGADIAASRPSHGIDPKHLESLTRLANRPTFLCVSTIEPRKRQDQILESFELLWSEQADLNLVFVGKAGWNVEGLSKRIREHNEFSRRLFWFEGISDELLLHLYEKADCVIAASENEGFGLSLIEGAKQGTPIIARDIPVFREIAGDSAHYFSGPDAASLANSVRSWLKLAALGRAPNPQGIIYKTWSESYVTLLDALLPKARFPRQILFDVSPLLEQFDNSPARHFWKLLFDEWQQNPIISGLLQPVFRSEAGQLFYAATRRRNPQLEATAPLFHDPAEPMEGDVFFSLVSERAPPDEYTKLLEMLHSHGTSVALLLDAGIFVDVDPAKSEGPNSLPREFRALRERSQKVFFPYCIDLSSPEGHELLDLRQKNGPCLARLSGPVPLANCQILSQYFVPTRIADRIALARRNASFVLFFDNQRPTPTFTVIEAFRRCQFPGNEVCLFVTDPTYTLSESDLVEQTNGLRSETSVCVVPGRLDLSLPLLLPACDCLILTDPNAVSQDLRVASLEQGLAVVSHDGHFFAPVSEGGTQTLETLANAEELVNFVKTRQSQPLVYHRPGNYKKYPPTISVVSHEIQTALLSSTAIDLMGSLYCLSPRIEYDHFTSKLRWLGGWSHAEEKFRWLDGNNGGIRFFIDSRLSEENQTLSICIGAHQAQLVEIFINETKIFTGRIEGERIISADQVSLRFGDNEIVIQVSGEAVSAAPDPRSLTVYFRWLRIGYTHKFGIVNKTYAKDLEWSLLLYRSFISTNDPDTPFFVITPRKEVELFRTAFSHALAGSGEGRSPTFMAEEDVLAAAGEEIPGGFTGWHTQQVVKLAFSRLGICENYLTLDSAIIFTRRLDLDNFFVDGRLRYAALEINRNDWFESIVKNGELGWIRGELRRFDEVYNHIGNFLQFPVDRTDALNFTFGVGLFSSLLCGLLLEEVRRKGLLSFSEIIEEAPYEFTWYGMFASRFYQQEAAPQGPLFKPIIQTRDFLDISQNYFLDGTYVGFLFQPPASDAEEREHILALITSNSRHSS